jgi:NAD-reducing hydrogenase large subunit
MVVPTPPTTLIRIDPVTRIEGHARISIQLDDTGDVQDAQLHITQIRGFEKFVEGRPFAEMPSLMARICGICPVSHLIASAKACDMLMAVQIPNTAANLRRIVNLAQIIQSHALSFFYLSMPDFLLGMDSDPAKRNLFGMLEHNPELARAGVRLRSIGQQIIEWVAGKRIHPSWIVPGGVAAPLTEETRDRIMRVIPEALLLTHQALEWYAKISAAYSEEIATFANFQTLYMAMMNEDGSLETYDGVLYLADENGMAFTHIDPVHYTDTIAEQIEPYSYLKSPYYKPMGYPAGIYRVGPLARLNMAGKCGTPMADAALADFHKLPERHSSFHYHYARLVEMLYAFEMIERLLVTEDILSPHVRAHAGANRFTGVGISEAPRGTLLHHYEIDENGLILKANLIIATGHNNLAMNRGITQAARHYLNGKKGQISEGMLNRVEAVIRAFDPCLSCSTHETGTMPLHVQVIASSGEVVSETLR